MDLLNRNKKKGGFAPVLIGIILIIVFTIVLFNNEGNSVHRAKALKNIKDAYEISSSEISSNYDKELVTFYGKPEITETLSDQLYKITVDNVIKLKRTVTMYQWKENATTKDDKTTYTYELIWSESFIDSSRFNTISGHENPSSMPVTSETFTAKQIEIGAFSLGNDFIKQLNNYSPYTDITLDSSLSDNIFLENNGLYISANNKSSFSKPQVGDMQVIYTVVNPEIITVLGEQNGSSLLPYNTKTGNLAELSYGKKGKEVLMNEKLDANKTKTWVIRIGSIIALIIANTMIFSPLTSLLGKIPLLGNIVNGGAFLMAVVLGGGWGLFVIAIGWLFYKPLLAITLIAIPIVAIVLLSIKGKKAATTAA